MEGVRKNLTEDCRNSNTAQYAQEALLFAEGYWSLKLQWHQLSRFPSKQGKQ